MIVLGIRTQGCRFVGEDKTTELWWPPKTFVMLIKSKYNAGDCTDTCK